MDRALDKELYKKVSKRADKIYETHSLYKSAWIQKEYQKLGGRYRGSKPTEKKGIQRWLSGEQWIEVGPYLKTGEKIQCGSSDRKGKACRPLKRVNSKTPITVPELLELHSKKKLMQLVKKKQRDMKGRLNWKSGTFSPSKKV